MTHEDLELYHHGVLGMKWGVRNSETLARYRRNRAVAKQKRIAKKKTKYAKDPKKAYKHRKMYSDKELDHLIERFGKEKKLKDFVPEDVKNGKIFLEGTANAAKNAGAIADTISKYVELNKKIKGEDTFNLNIGDFTLEDISKLNAKQINDLGKQAESINKISVAKDKLNRKVYG